MFDEDKEEWHRLFDYYKQHFGEEVGVICGILDSDDFEIDLFSGENSGKILGMRLYQVLEIEGKTHAGTGKKDKILVKGKDDEAGEEEFEETEENDDDLPEVLAYDLVLKPGANIQGKMAYTATLDLAEEGQGGEKESTCNLILKIYTVDGQAKTYVTGAMLELKSTPSTPIIFLEPPELK